MRLFEAVLVTMMLATWSSVWSATPYRLSIDELKLELTKTPVVLVDVRSVESYDSGHIEAAINFPVNLSFEDKSVDGALMAPAKAQAIFRRLGIDTNSQVVVYDDGSMMDASRIFWVLEVYGVKSVRVLNGGFEHWNQADLPISIDTPSPKPSAYVATVNHKRVATKLTTLLATKNPQHVIIDARSTSDYEGRTSTAKRYGHIPSALNIPAAQNVYQVEGTGSHFFPPEKLESLYGSISKEQQVILYCAIGRVSSSNYLALRELGYDVANYDASWHQWGNDVTLPIVSRISVFDNQ